MWIRGGGGVALRASASGPGVSDRRRRRRLAKLRAVRLPRTAGVQLHPTSLPGGRLGPRGLRLGRLARRCRPGVVADAAARSARPLRLALQGGLRVRGVAGAAGRAGRAGVEGRGARLPRARGRLDRGLGALRRPRRGRRPGPLRARVDGAARLRERARRAADRRRADLRRARLGRPPRASRAVPRRRGRRHAARRLHRQGPALGQPALRLAGAAAPRLPLVDRAARAHVLRSSTSRGSTTSAASSPTGRCRRRARTRARRALAAAGRGARCSTPRARRSASCRSSPRTSA